MKNSKIILIILPALFLLASFTSPALAETDCDIDYNECKITITIKIAFAGATDQQIQDWGNEIEDVWNGPNNYQTTGDCDCEVKFEVETMKITDPANVNCNPPPAGYHCVMVTPWNNNNSNLPWFYRPDGTKEYVTAYMGYNSQSPSQGGASIDGWWSDQTSRPAQDAEGNPTGENYKDAAHEAGHMMGLGDDDGAPNIMGQTSGPNAQPTQAQIDQVVENVCGEGACPDHCCCGNGTVDKDKGEECDPMAESSDCKEGEFCCIICCQCHSQLCNPEDGEYATQSDCQRSCEDGQCLFNYQTGCWDCKRYESKITVISTTDWLGIGGGILFLILFISGLIFKKTNLFVLGVWVLVIGTIAYFSPNLSKFLEKPIEEFPEFQGEISIPSPEPSQEFAGFKESVLVLPGLEGIQQEIKDEKPSVGEPPAEELPTEGPPIEEELPPEEQPPIEEPPIIEEKRTPCQITCQEAGFLDGQCLLFSEGIGSCEEQGLFTPPFADEYCELTGEPGIYNVCCCILE